METFEQIDYVHICVQVRSVCACMCECAHVCMCVNKSHILILNSEFILIHPEILKLKNSNLSVRRPEQPNGLPWVTRKLPQSPGTRWFSLPCVSVTSAQPCLPGLIIPHQESTRQQFAGLSGPWERAMSATQASSISRRMPARLSCELISFS